MFPHTDHPTRETRSLDLHLTQGNRNHSNLDLHLTQEDRNLNQDHLIRVHRLRLGLGAERHSRSLHIIQVASVDQVQDRVREVWTILLLLLMVLVAVWTI